MAILGSEVDSKEEVADDCFHMVTQYNWEEDIIWNGDDIKHKVKCETSDKNALHPVIFRYLYLHLREKMW